MVKEVISHDKYKEQVSFQTTVFGTLALVLTNCNKTLIIDGVL